MRRKGAAPLWLLIGAGVSVAVVALAATSARPSLAVMSPLAIPLKVTSPFGAARASGAHKGVDLQAPLGTPVLAPEPGRLRWWADARGGLGLRLEADSGLVHDFAHLSERLVSPGPVGRGATIARTGATGDVTGPHLHWEVKGPGGFVDPLSLVA